MENLKAILERLREGPDQEEMIFIPSSWNYVQVQSEKDPLHVEECRVNKREFCIRCLEEIIATPRQELPENLFAFHIYSMLMRTFSAWRHNGKEIQGGTLLKTICLLPLLKDLGINCIYLLPVFESSGVYKKGELSSPYSIRDVMRISTELQDPLLQGISAERQFSAFVECCHHLGMKVILDFVFRTVSRDNDLLRDHPEYFYWIHAEKELEFSAPTVKGIGHTVPNPEVNRKLYQSEDMGRFLTCFAPPPTPEEWQKVRERVARTGENLLDAAREELSIVTMPGFADTINDPQPPWTDITFLKLYYEPTPFAKECLDTSKLPPFIAQDGVKCSSFQGESPNLPLWEYIETVILFYMDQYHIDGARIDMAHALPTQLTASLLKKIRQKNSGFLLWSEEYWTEKAGEAKRDGYDFITGGIWNLWDRYREQDFNEELGKCIRSVLPVVSALETADTPRGAYFLRHGERKAALFLSYLLPNTIVSVNNGQEFCEIQPMNLGLKITDKGRYVLPPSHPLYGKLCFFDEYAFDWTAKETLKKELKAAFELRQKLLSFISRPEKLNLKLLSQNNFFTQIMWYDKREGGYLAVFNRKEETQYLFKSAWKELLSEETTLQPMYASSAEEKEHQIIFKKNGFIIYRLVTLSL